MKPALNGIAMNPIPQSIAKYIRQHHVVTLCTSGPDGASWSCNVFYVFEEPEARFFILSELKTTHARFMLDDARVSGTVTAHPRFIASIQGVQFLGLARMMQGDDDEFARKIYYKKFPIARILKAPVWEIQLNYIKMTNNKLGFAHKEEWRRQDP